MRAARAALTLGALLVAPLGARGESPRYGSVELGAGPYRPNIDAQGGLQTPLPYEQIFGTGRGWMFRVGISKAIFTYPGALELGIRSGFFRATGKAPKVDASGSAGTVPSADDTTFNIIPTSLTLTYRFDLLADRYGVPFAPYGRLALERYNWWVTGGSGGTSKNGATNGWSATGGIAFLLDFLDPALAREFDLESGVNHTYLFFDVTKTKVNGFGSSTSWDLSDDKLSLGFGMMFVF